MTTLSQTVSKAEPRPTPTTQPFWDAAARHELWMQRSTTTGQFVFYPRAHSPFGADDTLEWVQVSGKATLDSYVINHRPAPGFTEESPYIIAIVKLAEGPRMLTNIVGVEASPENLVLDMELEVVFEDRDSSSVPLFRPVRGAA